MLVNGTPDEVWEVLADGWSYAQWVPETTEIRDVDASWPEVGSSLHFRVARGPLQVQSRTTVRVLEPPRHIELEAHAPPVGSARVAIDIVPWADDAVVILDEHPLRGPGARLHNGLVELGLHLRTRKMLADLARTVQQRHSLRLGEQPGREERRLRR